jgi:tetratricopeptide (TPR) repeat protein|tara:strand:+ start:119 stop:613 length:495 start_codon:yes stop_codon:yes gene_type:complete
MPDAAAAEVSLQSALSQLQGGDLSGGAALLSRLLSPSSALPTHRVPDARANLGTALMMLGRVDDAEREYMAAVELRPTALEYYNLGILCADRQRNEEAHSHYRAAIALEPTSAAAYNNLGNLYRSEDGRSEEATAMYRGALLADPRHAFAYNNLANMLKADGRV